MIRLSNKQLAFLDAIEKHVRHHNYSPSVRELALKVTQHSARVSEPAEGTRAY